MPENNQRADPFLSLDPGARAEALALMQASHAVLAWTDPETGTPGISRIAFANDAVEGPMTLISAIAPHFRALQASPDCALLLGDAGPKGDAMNQPRLMVRAKATFLESSSPGIVPIKSRWLARNPKAAAYINLPDFAFVRLETQSATLNGGFARAYRLSRDELDP